MAKPAKKEEETTPTPKPMKAEGKPLSGLLTLEDVRCTVCGEADFARVVVIEGVHRRHVDCRSQQVREQK